MSVSFSYKPTIIGFIATALVTVLAMISLVIFGINPNRPTEIENGGKAYPASLLAMANGCGDIFVMPPKEGQYGVIPSEYWELNSNPIQNIPVHIMTVPVYGYMAEKSMPDEDIRFYGPEEVDEPLNRQLLLRTMYDKDIIVLWYSKELNAVDINLIRQYVANSDQKILAYPWLYENNLVAGRNVAFAKWGISQTCSLYSDEVFEEFVIFANDNTVNKTFPPPEAPMTNNGTLLPIGGSST